MSSIRRINSSRANGARSAGPVTHAGKYRSSLNAETHGLLSHRIVMDEESPEAFASLLAGHLDRIQPADAVEYGLVEEMVASNWRLRRAWAIETRLLENETDSQPQDDPLDRMANATDALSAGPTLGLLHRYETRLHLMYQRALHNILLLRAFAEVPNEPSPISGHPKELPPGE